ncbi:YkgJ family cysteine cluster protein [Geobacter sulfurreducens subsp. ethanolicus]|uniref:YkgJ family cysteine cluster protein n=1 Tax=Geobacter sulfurreducens TaxID=35554 RepID=UPI00257254FA|nr:YkgJ family cysteine cluster protein [Geobacter sulfurreducens]BEH11277.1 YkgJ family cysteine cluster protein [Geobacter sulfurreducens subsp. ethanolicus]
MVDNVLAILRMGEELADLAVDQFDGVTDPAGIAPAITRIVARVEELLSTRQNGGHDVRIACGPGCMTCCTVNVSVLVPEAWTITAWLRQRLDAGEVDRLAERLVAAARAIRWLDDADRIRGGVTCPFLDERGWCSIHPVRPLMCRALTSADPAQCRRALESRTSDEEVLLECNLLQKYFMEQAYRSLAAVLERRGIDSAGRELVGTVARFLNEPRLADEFLAGRLITLPQS